MERARNAKGHWRWVHACLPLALAATFLLGSCGEEVSLSGGGGQGGGSNSLTLYWAAPMYNEGGTVPLTDLAGYLVYYGPNPGSAPEDFDNSVFAGNVTSFTIDSLPSGTVYVAVSALDSSGNESALSNGMSHTF